MPSLFFLGFLEHPSFGDDEGMTGAAKRAFTRALIARGYSGAMVAEAKREGRWWLAARTAAARRRGGLYEGHVVLWNDGTTSLVPCEVAAAGAHEVTIETLASAISPGTERAQYLRLPNTNIPSSYSPGYSLAGRALEVGHAVEGIAPGDLVAAIRMPHASVGTVPAHAVFPVPGGVRAEEA